MDAFYASVEQRDNPALRGKPVAVGGSKERGVVAAASYEARKFGVKSAMPSVLARKRCPHLIFVKPRFEEYKKVSQQIRDIFLEYTPLVEPLSLDEAYLDVTENLKGIESANQIAKEIRQRIYDQTQLTASAGISINKFLAKVASNINKPNGQKTIHPNQIDQFLNELPIAKLHGIGKVTAQRFKDMGVFYGKDLKELSPSFLSQNFGKSGIHYYNVVRGIHNSPVNPNRIRKSIGVERTFSENIIDQEDILDKLVYLSNELENRLSAKDKEGRTLTLKIKYADFTQYTRSITLIDQYFKDKELILENAQALWHERPKKESVRLLGLSVTNFKGLEDDTQSVIQLEIPFKKEGFKY
ncbi:DNA polymerase IV [Flavobacteriaceae bacterium Ap0902]|nr:DNA polymerase IV [Flavobacteriaceae bacterium Ap0902]